MDITAIHQIFLTCTSVTTDSRNCPQGSLFIALKGESFNGNAFAARALESGSAYAIVDEEAYAPEGDTRYIVVENSLKTLQQLANYHRRQMRTPIIGITGTNGKTTTKELMSTVLSQTHNVLYTLGNLNNHIGVPLTLLRLRPEHDLAVVEMNEAADILNNVSSRSLVLFDELGRGTSTYDGISIAWAIVEYIHEHPKAKARTLFATHYHELNEMEKSFKRIKNYNVSVKEVDNKVIFLRKLERGGSEHSFGIHVAKMAGMPKSIVKRANTILKQLESDNRQQGISGKPLTEVSENRSGMQLSFFQLDDPILCQIRDEILNLDVNNLTPIEALNKLNDIKKIVRGK